MSIYKRGNTYWYKFMWNGELVRESTKQGNDRVARNMEAGHRTRLAMQEDARKEAYSRLKCSAVELCAECEKWFDRNEVHSEAGHVFCSGACVSAWTKRRVRIPELAEFLKNSFSPYIETQLSAKPKTVDYYRYGVALLLEAGMGNLPLNQISSKHAAGYIAKHTKRSPSTVNCGLRTLRRALNLAEEWGTLEHAPKLQLAKGERQRDRIVTHREFLAYRELCRQPWRDVATVLYGTGMRPGEAYKLRWEHVLLNGTGGLIQIAEGKTKAARRFLPMVPEVYATLKARHQDKGSPATGWVFPSGAKSGHLEESSAKIYHGEVVRKLTSASTVYAQWAEGGTGGDWVAVVARETGLSREYVQRHGSALQAGWKGFEPYCLRQSALTMLAESGCDAFTLARIAGHSSITITQRYCHPQADAIDRAFRRLQAPESVSVDATTPSNTY